MPSLNLKTKTLRYAKSDVAVLDAAVTLLDTMIEYDSAAKKDATDARSALGTLRAHVRRQRGETQAVPPKPAA